MPLITPVLISFEGFKLFSINSFLSFSFVPSIQLVVNTFIVDKCLSTVGIVTELLLWKSLENFSALLASFL